MLNNYVGYTVRNRHGMDILLTAIYSVSYMIDYYFREILL